jgi:Tfp pilus assembly protein PilN
MRAVNLLPSEVRRQTTTTTDKNPVAVGAVAGAVLVTAVLAAWFLTASGDVASNQKRADAAQAELAATPVPPPTLPGASQLEQEKNARIAALSSALAGRLAWDRVFRELSLVLPDDVWLTSLSAQAPAVGVAASSTSGAGFTMNGKTYSHDGVARLLARLAVVPHLSNVQLQHSSLTTSPTGRKVVEFTVNASIKAPGAA